MQIIMQQRQQLQLMQSQHYERRQQQRVGFNVVGHWIFRKIGDGDRNTYDGRFDKRHLNK